MLVVGLQRGQKLTFKLDVNKFKELLETESAEGILNDLLTLEFHVFLKPHIFQKMSTIGCVIDAPPEVRILRTKLESSSGT